jgi:hypothetical protein
MLLLLLLPPAGLTCLHFKLCSLQDMSHLPITLPPHKSKHIFMLLLPPAGLTCLHLKECSLQDMSPPPLHDPNRSSTLRFHSGVEALGPLWPRLQHLEELLLCSKSLGADVVKHVQLPEDVPLEFLVVSNCRGLFPHFTPQLAKMTRLQELHAKDCGICAADLAAIAPALSSSLTLLDLSFNGGYNSWSPRALYGSLGSLLQLTALQHLDVQQCVIADNIESTTHKDGPVCAALAAALTGLTYLAIGASWKCDPISAADAAQLAKLTQLQELHLHDIELGFEGVAFLSSLTKLTLLELNECNPGAAGKAAIRAALPGVRLIIEDMDELMRSSSGYGGGREYDSCGGGGG